MKYLLIPAILILTLTARAERTIPLTPEAQENIGKITAEIPEDWKKLGYVKPTASTDIKHSLLGIGGETLCRDFANFDEYKDYLEPLGAKRIRLQSGWAKTEKEQGVYDFGWLDHIIDESIKRGVEPWLEYSYGNPIYPGAGGVGLGQGMPSSEEGLAAWDRYVTEATKRYADKVYYYEVWNEADHGGNFNRRTHGDLTGDEWLKYPRLYIRTAEIIRKYDPDAYIVALAIAGVGRQQTVQVFFDYLKEQGKLHLVDAISIHGYPQNPDNDQEHVKRLRAFMDMYAPWVHIWQGETGAPSRFQESLALRNLDWSELSQAKWNTRRALSYVGRGIPFSMFQISDMNYKQSNYTLMNTKGLLHMNEDLTIKRARLAYFSYQNLCSLFNSKLIPMGEADIESGYKTLSAYRFYDPVEGRSSYVFWDNRGKPNEEYTRTNIRISLENFRILNPVYVDLVSGAVYALPEEHVERYNATAILRDIPVWDGPVMITDASLVPLLTE